MTLVVREGKRCKVQRAWQGKTAVCIAGGPSLTPEALELVRAARERDAIRVIAVNDLYLVAPWADACYFADASWWRKHEGGLPRSWPWLRFNADQVRAAHRAFAGQWISIQHPECIRDERVFLLENAGAEGLSESAYAICTGANSGFQALSIVVHGGASAVLLVAYDMRYHGNRSHSHNGHEQRMPESAYAEFARKFTTLQRPLERLGVAVKNCTPGSKISAFPIVDLGAALGLACAPTS